MRLIAGLVLAGLLAGCSEEAEAPQDAGPVEQGGKAAGEVLGGTISDDMIALEQITSQSPPEKPVATTGAGGAAAPADADGDADATTPDAAPDEEGAASTDAAPPE